METKILIQYIITEAQSCNSGMDMDEEFHKSLLQHFCRVCGGRLAKHGKTFEYSFTAHTSDLSSVFGVHIGSDYPYIHPPSFFKPCYAKLQQVSSATKKGIGTHQLQT